MFDTEQKITKATIDRWIGQVKPPHSGDRCQYANKKIGQEDCGLCQWCKWQKLELDPIEGRIHQLFKD